jgi:hypothetical protein|tara:strand:- start:84 stop:404 length:321 start_codon:yes stop_codon:yes gene_type:complete
MEEKIFIDFEPNDFIIRITPILDEDNKWVGELRVGTITTDDNTLDDEDYSHLMYLATMLCSSVPFMEQNDKFRSMLDKYTQETLEPVKTNPTVEYGKDNVVKLNFN